MERDMKIWLCVFCVAVSTVVISACDAGGTEICVYVSPTGKDSNNGDKTHPLKTLTAARDLMRSRRGSKTATRTVYLRGGRYRLRNTFSLGASDSGFHSAPVVYKAYGNEQVVLSGGEIFSLKDFTRVSDPAISRHLKSEVRGRTLELDVSSYVEGNSDWPDHFPGYAGWPGVYAADKALHLARWPNSGYAKIAEIISGDSSHQTKKSSGKGCVFRYQESAPSRWNTNQEIYLNGYWYYKWSDEVIRIASIDKKNRIIKLTSPHVYGLGGPSGGLYYAMNLPEELDRTDEYVFDREKKKIYIIPPAKRSPADFGNWHISFMKSALLRLSKTANIIFENIVFEDNIGSAAIVASCQNVTFQNCVFRNIGNSAVDIRNGENCGLDKCLIYNIGGTAVNLSGGNRKTLTAAGHYVNNCSIHHFARLKKTYRPAVNLNGVGQRVANNYIHDAPHNAILFGGNNHIIENNRIERVCLDTGDAGAIYCGRDWTLGGNIIRRNWIANLGYAEHSNNWGVYLDDIASGIEVRENIIIDSPSGMLIGGGRNNVIADNLVVRCKVRASIHYDNRGIRDRWTVPSRREEPNSDNVMWKRLNKMPYHRPPWSTKFPYLLTLDKDNQPGMPKYSVVTGNRSFGSAPFKFSEYVSQFGVVGNNVESDKDLKISLSAGKVIIERKYYGLKRFSEFHIGPANK